MSDSSKTPKTPEELQKEIQTFFKDKFGADIFSIPLGDVGAISSQSGNRADGEAGGAKGTEQDVDEVPDDIRNFNMRPAQVKAHLDRYVIGQEEAKRTLAVAVCDHYGHVRRVLEDRKRDTEERGPREGGKARAEYVKQNVILLGPTGVGKTYLIRILAELIGVPFVKADITKFSETGYVGGDVEDLMRELYRIADGNATLAEHGIIFLDEIDKIASSPSSTSGRDPSGRGVQVALLKLMEDTEVSLRNPLDLGAQFQDMMQMGRGSSAKRTVNTRHVLFVVSGAFSSLTEIIEKRLRERNIGFSPKAANAEEDEGDLLAKATTKDFVDFGLEPEFVGRLPIRCALDELGDDELFRILKNSEGSILHQYRESFRGYGIEAAFEDESLREIASRAYAEKTGARGLMTVLDAALRDFKFYLPDTEVRGFAVTRGLVEAPQLTLKEIIENPEQAANKWAVAAVREWEEDFDRAYGVRLVLDDEAVAMATNVAAQLGRKLLEHLDDTFADHKDFLRKIMEQSGRSELPVTPHVLNRPAEGVETWLGKNQAET